MKRIDRALGILLLLGSGAPVTAAELARRFEVSRRTIYRDLEALSALGVPLYGVRGGDGGYRLLEGYFLPPVTFTRGEAVVLFLALALLKSLGTRPLSAELETAERKLLAALPERLRAVLARAPRWVGVEPPPHDAFHRSLPAGEPAPGGAALDAFLGGLLDGLTLRLRYRSPYRGAEEALEVRPLGVIWDRDHWYLVARPLGPGRGQRLFRLDRVQGLEAGRRDAEDGEAFDVRALLGRAWLEQAMADWALEAPVELHLLPEQAERLRQDWYYRHARFEPLGSGRVRMTFGEDDPQAVLELVRWLGPGAELVRPEAWRRRLREELGAMARAYALP